MADVTFFIGPAKDGPYLHEARLVGSYHTYKVQDTATFERWLNSLAPDDLRFIQRYARLGQWGRLNLAHDAQATSDRWNLFDLHVGPVFLASFQQIGLDIAAAGQQLGAAFSRGLADAVQPDPVKLHDLYISHQRDGLGERLFTLGLPSRFAWGVAEHWPEALLPVVFTARCARVVSDFNFATADLCERFGVWIDDTIPAKLFHFADWLRGER